MPHRWKPWVDVQTGLAPAPRHVPARAPLRVTTMAGSDESGDVQTAVRAFLVGVFFAALAGYHGYRRNNDSVLWGLSWAAGGFVCPVVTVPFAVSQGFAKKKG